MARTKKPRTEEVKAVFDNLKYCSATELNDVINKANGLLETAKKAELAEKKAQLEALKAEIAELEK